MGCPPRDVYNAFHRAMGQDLDMPKEFKKDPCYCFVLQHNVLTEAPL